MTNRTGGITHIDDVATRIFMRRYPTPGMDARTAHAMYGDTLGFAILRLDIAMALLVRPCRNSLRRLMHA